MTIVKRWLYIKGAFDKEFHNVFLSKLKAKWIKTNLLTWINLSGRSICVALSGQSSNTTSVNTFVPQGSILSYLLFSDFIDDLIEVCQNQVFLYADSLTSAKVLQQVQTSLDVNLERMKDWADRQKVAFEPSKCKAMVISRKQAPSQISLFFERCQLALHKHLDMGLTFDSKLLWDRHILKNHREGWAEAWCPYKDQQ